MLTINALSVLFKAVADQHPQINQYGIGQVYNIAADEAVNYPLLWVVPNGGDLDSKTFVHRFNFLLLDRMKEDASNEIEILSDCQTVLTEVITILQTWSDSKEYEVEWLGTYTPIIDEHTDIVAGVSAQVGFKVAHLQDACAIPGEYTEPDILITDDNDYLLWT